MASAQRSLMQQTDTLDKQDALETEATSTRPDTAIALVAMPRVLFPSTFMPLNVFEPRYSRMVKECLALQAGVGIIYSEQTFPADTGSKELAHLVNHVGTYGVISDWYAQQDQTLSLSIDGLERFQIIELTQEEDGLLKAKVRWLPEPSDMPVPEEYKPLADLLQQIAHHPLAKDCHFNFNLHSANAVSLALAHHLPFSDKDKQLLLECKNAEERLGILSRWIAG